MMSNFHKELIKAELEMSERGVPFERIQEFVNDHLLGRGHLWHGPVDHEDEAWWLDKPQSV